MPGNISKERSNNVNELVTETIEEKAREILKDKADALDVNDLKNQVEEKVDKKEGYGLATFLQEIRLGNSLFPGGQTAEKKINDCIRLTNGLEVKIPNYTSDLIDDKGFLTKSNEVGQKTAEKGEIFNDYEGNKAIAEDTHVEGQGNFAGQKAYYYSDFDVDNNTFTISDVKGTATTTINTGWVIGDLVSIVNDAKYLRFATITNINGNIITVSNMPAWEQSNGIVEVDFTKWDGFDDFTIFVQDKPENGIVDIGQSAHVEGRQNKALANGAHAEGRQNMAFGQYSHVEGRKNFAYHAAHAEGMNTRALAMMAHAEGDGSLALGKATHAEGANNTAEGLASHAEGHGTIASGHQAHSEGYNTYASNYSHAEGQHTKANSGVNHAEGVGTIATGFGQHVQGRYNVEDTEDKYAHIIGHGYLDQSANTEHRRNIHTVDWSGNAWFAGDVTVGANKEKLVTESVTGDIETALDSIIAIQNTLMGVSE